MVLEMWYGAFIDGRLEVEEGIGLDKGEKKLGQKKRVLLVIRWPVGGIRTFLRYVYRNFDASKWKFTIVAPEYDEMKVLLDDLSEMEVSYIPIRGGDTRAFFRQASSVILRGRYDLVHSHGFTSGVCAAVPAFLSRTPHLLTSHDVLNDEQFSGLRGRIKKTMIGRILNMINRIQSVSHDAQSNLLEHFPALGRETGKCVVISNGIEVQRFLDAPPRDLKAELGLGEDVFLIGFMGRFMAQKGFRYLVDAMEILTKEGNLPKKPIVLTFGEGRWISREKQSVNDRGLEDSFMFLPFTANVAGTIKGIDVLAIPSLWEACPLLPMEALVCGIPVIGSDCIGLREVLEGTPAKMVPKANAKALAEAFECEINSPGKQGFEKYQNSAMKRFDVKVASASISELYAQLLKCHF